MSPETLLKRKLTLHIRKEMTKYTEKLCEKCQKDLLRKHFDSAIEHCHKIISLNQEAIKELESRKSSLDAEDDLKETVENYLHKKTPKI